MIRLLSDETINQIAAGEVIERPLSIVKELLENAIDAGATSISIEIKEGGLSLIRITDNGSGIEKEEVPTAFLRHATSKIREASDLEQIHTLGFRGEALASIAAVARVEVITKRAEELLATQYQIEGGVEKLCSEIGAPDGTTMIVRDLFYNVPARKKFLKSPSTESARIQDIVEKEALAHPELAFRLIQDGKQKLQTLGNGSLLDVIYAIFGREVASQLITVKKEFMPSALTGIPKITIKGFIGKPATNRSNRNYEIYFVNGRFVKNPLLQKAIEDGYRAFLMQHKFPFTVLMVDVSPELVDVNVHPQKLEVRFAEGLTIYNAVVEAIDEALHREELIVNTDLESIKTEKKKEIEGESYGAEPFETNRGLENREKLEEKLRTDLPNHALPLGYRQTEGSGFASDPSTLQADVSSKQSLHSTSEGSHSFAENSPQAETDSKQQSTFGGRSWNRDSDYRYGDEKKLSERKSGFKLSHFSEELGKGIDTPHGESLVADTLLEQEHSPFHGKESLHQEHKTDISGERLSNEAVRAQQPDRNLTVEGEKQITGEQESLFTEKFLSEKARLQHRIIGQVFETYWLIEYGDKLFIIDQHAAHEKVNFERMMKRLSEKAPVSQYLNPPILLSLGSEEALLLEKYMEYFEGFGYEIRNMGGRDFSVTAVPADLPELEKKDLLLEILDELSEETSMTTPETIYDRIATMSCKAAVKGNNKLSLLEADTLIGELLSLDNPYACPHGRPTIISMSKYELEKKFKRIV